MVGLGIPFSLPVCAERMRGTEGREQGNKGGRNGRVRKEMFVFGTSHSSIGNDQTGTNSSLSHCVFLPPISPHSCPSFLHPLLCAPSSFWCWQGYRRYASPTIPVPLSIRSPPLLCRLPYLPPSPPSTSLHAGLPAPSPFRSGGGGHRNGQ